MSIQLFDGSPFRILVGRDRGWGSVSYISKAIAQELNLQNSDITINGYSTQDSEISLRTFGTPQTGGVAVEPTSTGQFSVQISYTNNTTGEVATADFLIEGVDGSEPIVDNNFLSNTIESAANNYNGYDLFVTEEEIRAQYSDGTSDVNNLEIKVTGGGYVQREADPNATIYQVEDGVWAISQEDYESRPVSENRVFFFYTVTDPDTGVTFSDYAKFSVTNAPSGYVPEFTLDTDTAEVVSDTGINFYDPEVPFEGYDPINNWKPQRRVEINPGGPAAESLGDELVINDANGRLFGINNRASDSTFDDITGVAFVMGAEGAFDDGTIAGKEYIGTLEFDLKEGYRTTANFNTAQLEPLAGSISPDGTLDGAMVSTETGEVLALFESVNVL